MWPDGRPELDGERASSAIDGFLSVDLHGARFLAGPTGAFLVVEGTDPATLELLALRSDQVRTVLGRHLQWVPFLHPVVVSEQPHLVPRAVTLSVAELRIRMATGRRCIEPETLDRIQEIVDRRILHIDALSEPSGGSPVTATPPAPG